MLHPLVWSWGWVEGWLWSTTAGMVARIALRLWIGVVKHGCELGDGCAQGWFCAWMNACGEGGLQDGALSSRTVAVGSSIGLKYDYGHGTMRSWMTAVKNSCGRVEGWVQSIVAAIMDGCGDAWLRSRSVTFSLRVHLKDGCVDDGWGQEWSRVLVFAVGVR
ncbi:hypothetical protein JB92DRAFT_2824658 [Gautieria morchelliformis]|nr:hypothetical protein JB92DRAFT_2824658 [Gautieria morchelliformis]